MENLSPKTSDYFAVHETRGVVLFDCDQGELVKEVEEKEDDVGRIAIIKGESILKPNIYSSELSYHKLLKQFMQDQELIPR